MKPTTHEKASWAKRLRDDHAFQWFMQEIKDEQAATFLNPASSQENRDAAHEIIRALHQIEQRLDNAEGSLKFEQKRDQHRAHD